MNITLGLFVALMKICTPMNTSLYIYLLAVPGHALLLLSLFKLEKKENAGF